MKRIGRSLLTMLLVLSAGSVSCSSDEDTTESSEDASADGTEPGCNAHLDGLTQVVYSADGAGGCHWTVTPGADDHEALQTALVEVNPGQTVCLAAGTFTVRREVNLGTSFVTIKGAGREETIIDFSEQTVGANGVHITSDNVTVEGLTVRNSAGDGLRATGSNNLVIRNVAVIWTAFQSKDSGAYGLYPIQCDGVLIEDSLVIGARDAGFYVGQSRNIVVQNNEAHSNVAGFEIENSFDAVVRNNHAHDNTGGILVFNLPGLPQKNGERCLVENNLIENNNGFNFGLSGSVVGRVPSGTGVLILSADYTEVTGNTIRNNESFGVVGLFYEQDLFGKYDDPEFDPYTEGTWIHDNTYESNGNKPAGITVVIEEETLGDVAFGGCIDPDKNHDSGVLRNCVSEAEGTTYINFDLCGGFATKTRDISEAACTQPAREPVQHCATGLKGGFDCGTVPEPGVLAEVNPDIGCAFPYPKLSNYDFFTGNLADLTPAAGAHPYDVASQLWSDGAVKDRFIVLPAGTTIGFDSAGVLTFPVGATLIKTFSFQKVAGDDSSGMRRVETRLLVKEAHAWTPHAYLWNDEQTDAVRLVAGREVPGATDGSTYLVPSTAQCASCHISDGKIEPLGPVARQLHRPVERDGVSVDQLKWLADRGVFAMEPATTDLVANVDPFGSESLDLRARGYLDANCGHCHRKGGVAGSTGLRLDATETNESRLGVCKVPVAAGAGAGDLTYDIVPGSPEQSILVFRMQSQDASIQMPELPLMVLDTAGISLITEWIAAMPANDCKP
ncbi:MAG: parallel beta-helix repeat protein [Myxococcota bacterium]|jgi:parallel beta-helix repeat protein